MGFWTWFEKGKVEVGTKMSKNDENISVSVVEGKPLVFFKAYIIFYLSRRNDEERVDFSQVQNRVA